MICDRCTEVVIRKKDGRRITVTRCADPQSPHFTEDVTEEKCGACPRHQAQLAATATSQSPQMPSLAKRTKTWAMAVTDWKLQGSPERSDAEVARIHEAYCVPCSWYDPAKQVCKGCGCRVTRNNVAIFNKIKMATQHCPRRLW
jgi:hypothetical protein